MHTQCVLPILMNGSGLQSGYIFRTGTDGIDTVGLSIIDYLLVPTNHRSVYFVDESTMRSAEAIITNIEASEYLNDGGELVGNPLIGYAQYPEGTAESVLRRAYRYFGVMYPEVIVTGFPYTFPFILE